MLWSNISMDIFPITPTQELFGVTDIIKPEKPIPTIVKVESAPQNDAPIAEYADKAGAMKELQSTVSSCEKCNLSKCRKNVVFGEGNINAKLMFVGEGPGAEEDETGRPFVGDSGQLLDKMIIAMKLTREEVYIANIVKCRPPSNRNPFADEASSCIGYLQTQIDIVKPDYIVCLGSVATKSLIQNDTAISKLRGNWQNWRGYKVMPTYHPSYLLREPSRKKETWQDLQAVMAELGIKTK